MWPRLCGSAGQLITPSTRNIRLITRYSAPRSHGAIWWNQMGTVGYSALEKLRAEDLAPFVANGNQVGSPSLGSEQVYGIVLCCHDWLSYLCDCMCDYGNGLGWEGGAGLQYDKLRRGCSGPMVGRPFHHTHTHTHTHTHMPYLC